MDRSGLVPSNPGTAYHSFNDIELFEPASPPSIRRMRTPDDVYHDAQQGRDADLPASGTDDDDRPSTATTMKRQDSGYGGSNGATPRTSASYSRSPPQHPPLRRSSNASVAGLSSSRPRSRPFTRRSAKSYHHPPTTGMTTSSKAVVATTITPQQFQVSLTPELLLERPTPQHHHSSPSTYFHFPSPASTVSPADENTLLGPRSRIPAGAVAPPTPSPPTPAPSSVLLPPQTIHYWTSDRTRRLEYAAMDAASRGFKGWVRRNLVPDCMLAKEERHVAFDDDSGSVRRYRLELEDDQVSSHCRAEKARREQRRKTWHFWAD